MKYQNLILILFLVLSGTLFFNEGFSQKKDLTYEQVFSRGEPRLTIPLPRITGWLDDNYYLELRTEDKKQTVMKVNALTGEESVYLDYEEFNKKLPEGFTLRRSEKRTDDLNYFIFTDDLNHYIFRKNSNLYYYNLPEEEFRQLTGSESEEKNVTFSPDAGKIAFTRDNNLFVIDLATGEEKQLTNDGTDRIYNGWASWVYYEEILGRGSRYRAFWWSPDSKKLAYLRFDDNPVPEFTLFRADGIHGELEVTPYPKPGDPNPEVRLGIADIKTAKTVWIDTNEEVDRYVAWPFWTRDSKYLIYQYIPRDQDEITLFSSDPETGKKAKI